MENVLNVVESIPAILEGLVTLSASLLSVLVVVKAIVQGANKEQVERLVMKAVENAEEHYKDQSGKGEDKYMKVVQEVYGTLPTAVQLFFSLKDINGMVTEIVSTKNTTGEFSRGEAKDPENE